MFEELTQEKEIDLFFGSYKGRCNLFEKELTELFLKSYKEKYNLSEEELKRLFFKLSKEKYYLSSNELLDLFLEVYKKRNLSEEELEKLFLKLSEENGNLFEDKLKESFLELYKEKYNLSEEALKELFLKVYLERYYLSEEELLELRADYNEKKIKIMIAEAAHYDLLPVIKYFIEKGGNPYFVIEEYGAELTILNVAAKKGSLDIINYLLDKNIFTVDQRASKNSATPFHSAVEGNNIKAAELLMQKRADINAKFNIGEKKTVWYYIFTMNHIEMAKFLLKHGIYVPDIDLLDRREVGNLLLPIKELEDLYLYDDSKDSDFISAYNALNPEVQEIWDIRVSKYRFLSKLAEFIEKKFSKENAIGYKEYAVLREYSSLPKHKKEALEILLAQKNFNPDDLIKVDNYIKVHFFEIACTVKALTGTAFEAIAEAGIIGEITQYLHFEDSGIKIAGASSDSSADNITN
ncbi:MAG TPA: ankyrin repeat domain-containing protein [Rickettsia endosymbiont of Omalisus fontisbellaquei]|nr:ankyrin repeat domain-containing protein [Rickettsia endosymbiont of Omalisus fontisbellaquei]